MRRLTCLCCLLGWRGGGEVLHCFRAWGRGRKPRCSWEPGLATHQWQVANPIKSGSGRGISFGDKGRESCRWLGTRIPSKTWGEISFGEGEEAAAWLGARIRHLLVVATQSCQKQWGRSALGRGEEAAVQRVPDPVKSREGD